MFLDFFSFGEFFIPGKGHFRKQKQLTNSAKASFILNLTLISMFFIKLLILAIQLHLLDKTTKLTWNNAFIFDNYEENRLGF